MRTSLARGVTPCCRRARPSTAGCLLAASLMVSPLVADAQGRLDLTRSVVKIRVTSAEPDYLRPWLRDPHELGYGSGVVIDGGRVLTNAHVVENRIFVELEREGDERRVLARVVHVSHVADLALLAVEDPAFAEALQPLPFGSTPSVQDDVEIVGFPIGGETLSVTSGVVSRLVYEPHAHSGIAQLLVQVDAAINPGNSGGPAMAHGSIVGLAVQGLSDAENAGYVIPVSAIAHFLKDAADGQIDGIPSIGIRHQSIRNPSLRRYLGLEPGSPGVLVRSVLARTSASNMIREGDIVVAIDGKRVGVDGLIRVAPALRLPMAHAAQARQVGDHLVVTVLRNGAPTVITLPLRSPSPPCATLHGESQVRYLLFSGLLFQPLTRNYLKLFENAPARLARYCDGSAVGAGQRREVVVLNQVLAHAATAGYQDFEDLVIERVDGVPVRSLEHLAALIEGAEGAWLTVEAASGKRIVLDRTEARRAHREILEFNGIPADRWLDAAAHGSAALLATSATGGASGPSGLPHVSGDRRGEIATARPSPP